MKSTILCRLLIATISTASWSTVSNDPFSTLTSVVLSQLWFSLSHPSPLFILDMYVVMGVLKYLGISLLSIPTGVWCGLVYWQDSCWLLLSFHTHTVQSKYVGTGHADITKLWVGGVWKMCGWVQVLSSVLIIPKASLKQNTQYVCPYCVLFAFTICHHRFWPHCI